MKTYDTIVGRKNQIIGVTMTMTIRIETKKYAIYGICMRDLIMYRIIEI